MSRFKAPLVVAAITIVTALFLAGIWTADSSISEKFTSTAFISLLFLAFLFGAWAMEEI
jgi:hypothetical protein